MAQYKINPGEKTFYHGRIWKGGEVITLSDEKDEKGQLKEKPNKAMTKVDAPADKDAKASK